MSGATLAFDILAKDRASGTFDKVGHSSSTMGDKLKTVAKIGVAAVAASALVAGAALISMAKAALEDEKSQALLAKQLANSTGATKAQVAATEDWISKQGVALGVADDQLRPALSKLAAVTKDVGKAQALASLAMDVSAGTGKSLSTVSAALAKAQLGQVAGLAKLGVQTKNADGSTRSLKDITEDLAKTYSGSASAAANTAQGKFDRLKLVLDETKESIGAKLLPVLTDMATWFLTKGLPALQEFGGEINDKLGPAVTGLAGWLKDDLVPAVSTVAGWFSKHKDAAVALAVTIGALVVVTKVHSAVLAVQAAGGLLKYLSATKLVTTVTKTWAAVQWLMNAALTANPIGIVVVAIAALVGGLVLAYNKSETFRNIVNGLFGALKPFGEFIGKTLVGFVKLLASGFLLMGEYGIKAFRLLLTAAFTTFGGILAAADKGLGWIPGLGSKIGDAKQAFTEFSDSTVNKLKGVEDSLHRARDAVNALDGKKIRIDASVHWSQVGWGGVAANLAKADAADQGYYLQTGQTP